MAVNGVDVILPNVVWAFGCCVWFRIVDMHDECMRDAGLQEATVKAFTTGINMPLRRNHEADTSDANYKLTGKSWGMNNGDIPWVPTATETSHSRRYPAVYCRSEFTSELKYVDARQKIFKADPHARPWVRNDPEVPVVWHNFMIREFREKNNADECRKILEYPAEGSLLEKDSRWLHKRMA